MPDTCILIQTDRNVSVSRLRPIDIEFMKRLGKIVSIVPVIAKADTLTIDERQEFKERVRERDDGTRCVCVCGQAILQSGTEPWLCSQRHYFKFTLLLIIIMRIITRKGLNEITSFYVNSDGFYCVINGPHYLK